jgi:hypothetical protein
LRRSTSFQDQSSANTNSLVLAESAAGSGSPVPSVSIPVHQQRPPRPYRKHTSLTPSQVTSLQRALMLHPAALSSISALLSFLTHHGIELARGEEELAEVVAATLQPLRPAASAASHLSARDDSVSVPDSNRALESSRAQPLEQSGRKRSGRWTSLAMRLAPKVGAAHVHDHEKKPPPATVQSAQLNFPISHTEVILIAGACVDHAVAKMRDPLRELSELFVSLGGGSDLSGSVPFEAMRGLLETFCATAGDAAAEAVLRRHLVDAPFPIAFTGPPGAGGRGSLGVGLHLNAGRSGLAPPHPVPARTKGTEPHAQLTFGEFTALIGGLLKTSRAGAASSATPAAAEVLPVSGVNDSIVTAVDASPSRPDGQDEWDSSHPGSNGTSLSCTLAFDSSKPRGESPPPPALFSSPAERAQTACDRLRARVSGIRGKYSRCVVSNRFEQPKVLRIDGSVRPVSVAKVDSEGPKKHTTCRAPSMVQREQLKADKIIQELREMDSIKTKSADALRLAKAAKNAQEDSARIEEYRKVVEQRKQAAPEETPHWQEESLLLTVLESSERVRAASADCYERRKLERIKREEGRRIKTFLHRAGLCPASDDESDGAKGQKEMVEKKKGKPRSRFGANTDGNYELVVLSDVSAPFRIHATDLWSFSDLLEMLSDVVRPLPPRCGVTDVFLETGAGLFVPLARFSDLPQLARIKACIGRVA